MSPKSRKEYLERIKPRYRKAGRVEKGNILGEFCAVCGYERKYAIKLLSRRGPKGARGPRQRRGPKECYGKAELAPLKAIWLAGEQMCSKRLKAALPMWLPHYESLHGPLDEKLRRRLLGISPASIDRLLKPWRARKKRSRWRTCPGTLLRTQIPIRAERWEVDRPGYFEADTVAHGGNSMGGNFIWSLTFTDIFSGWTEMRAVWNKGSEGVVKQICDMEAHLVFPVIGVDCDNGSEFLNHHLVHYFAEHKPSVAFTRCRPYNKNDQAHVEQKNWTHVRQLMGYDRLDRRELVEPMNDLYAREWSFLLNFFCPTMKLLSKERINSKYRRRYETPQTPYQRIMDSPYVDSPAKEKLRQIFEQLNPFELKKRVDRKLREIFNENRRVFEAPPTRPFGVFLI